MKEPEEVPAFNLFGGPLQRLGGRLGLVRGDSTVRLGLALSLLAWGVLVVLAAVRGVSDTLFSLSMTGIHVRLLVALPLFFLAETWAFPRMAEFVRNIVHAGTVPEGQVPVFTATVRRIIRGKDSWLAEAGCLLLAFATPLLGRVVDFPGGTADLSSLRGQGDGRYGPAAVWYLWCCLPLFRFLLFRWLFRLVWWSYFLWRLSRIKLRLVPTHPDRAAGLGYLEAVHEQFVPLAVAASAFFAASFAENIAAGVMPFENIYRFIPVILLAVLLVFAGPLLLFASRLWHCRLDGWGSYMDLASRYVRGFDRKWIQGERSAAEPLLGTPDLQSLADLHNSLASVRELRLAPAGRRLVTQLAAAALLPMLPLLLFKYPIDELALRLLQSLTGL